MAKAKKSRRPIKNEGNNNPVAKDVKTVKGDSRSKEVKRSAPLGPSGRDQREQYEAELGPGQTPWYNK